MINRGGSNIYPLELEGVLAEHPNIVEAAVVGLPDAKPGEVPCPCVIPGDGSAVTLDEVTEFLRARELAAYKFPTRAILFEDFPRGRTMRVNRRQLAADVMAELGLN
jgi:acyl-CoA synthetase